MQRTRLRGWIFLILGAGLVGALGVPLLFAAHLPEPLATHWSITGVPNGSQRLLSFLAIMAAIVLVPGLLSFPRSGEAVGQEAPRALGWLAFGGALATLVSAQMVWANWDQASWEQARSISAAHVAVAVGVSLLLGVLVNRVARLRFGVEAATGSTAPSFEFGANERVFWTGSASNRFEVLLSVALLVAAALAAQRFALRYVFVPLLVAVVLEHVSKIRVIVNGQRVLVCFGRLGWVRQSIELGRVRRASAFDLLPMAHGGWGYRGSLWLFRRASVVVRRGPALRLELEGERVLQITVDDASTAADLINGLLARGRP